MRLLKHTTAGSHSLRIVVSNVIVDPSEVGIRLFGRIDHLQVLQSPSNHAVAEQAGK